MTDQSQGGGGGGGERKSGMGGWGSMTKINPEMITRYLKDIKFPVNKQGLINQARQKGVPEEVLRLFEKFQDRDYKDQADVAKEAGKVG